MRFIFLSILFSLTLFMCNKHEKLREENSSSCSRYSSYKYKYDYTIFKSYLDYTYIFKDASPSSLTSDDFILIDKMVDDKITIYNSNELYYKTLRQFNKEILKDSIAYRKKSSHNDKHYSEMRKQRVIKNSNIRWIELSNYKRQLVPIINSKGEKEVWINFLCDNNYIDSDTKSWRNTIFDIQDGGHCYFNLKINITNKVLYHFMVNGVA